MDSDSNCCGICLLEDGKAIRGWIDNCDHYFCFVCIMEWAKVESRCPMCKRRFSAIRRPAKPGVFPSERIVKVPVRDQVYHEFGNVTAGPSDPYAEVDCGICHGTQDESFLLICDLCDSAAHTYCIGLGHTVPEGDWFCHDCTVSRAEHDNNEKDSVFDDQNEFRNFYKKPSAETHVSIYDIVAEPYTYEDESPHFVAPHPNHLSSPVAVNSENSTVDRTSISSARTLYRCRNVNAHIQALRENWNALRSGSMTFSSILIDSGGESSQKQNVGASPQEQDDKACLYDTKRAWKMLDKAKSIQRDCGKTGTIRQVSKHPLAKLNALKEPAHAKSLAATSNRQIGKKDSGWHFKQCSFETDNKRHKPQRSENQVQSGASSKMGVSKFNESSQAMCSLGSSDSLSDRKAGTSSVVDVHHHRNRVRQSQKNLGDSFNVIDERDGYGCSVSPDGSGPRSPNLSNRNLKFGASHFCKEDPLHQGKGSVEKESTKKKARRDDAKSEIQPLVKLNLKLLCKDKQLGVETFKEVARLATHTILAACGLEHSKSCVRSLPTSVCTHSEQFRELHKSTLMPWSCRECFYAFVKDVVNFITAEKMGSAGSSGV